MASPITIHATHPTAHFYRESTTYSQPNHVRQLREGVVDPQRPHLYQQDRCQSPLRRGVHYRSTRLGGSLGPAQKDRPPSLGHNTLPGDRPMAPHFNLPASYSMSSPGSNADSNRVPIDRLTDRYPGPPTSATPTFRRPSEQTETTRLPGIGSLLSYPPESSRYEDGQRYQGPPHVPAFVQPRYPRHTPGSSVGSTFSEPISPNSYNGYPRSPVNQHQAIDDRGRNYSHPQYSSSREDRIYDHPQAVHAATQHASAYPPPPVRPSGPDTMLPPPPDPFSMNSHPYHPQGASYSYAQPHTPHVGSSWERPRIDSNTMPLYDHGLNPAIYPWGYPGTHGANSMARKRRGNLPKEATKILKDWFGKHHESPYPTEDEKQELCRMTNLQISQVNNWFINARRRLPREDAKKLLDKEDQDRAGTEDSENSDMMNGAAVEGSMRY